MGASTPEPDAFSGPSFSFRNRLARAIWGVAHFLLIRWTPKPFHAWRAFVLRMFGAKLGRNCHIYPKAIIWAPWNFEAGDQCGIANRAIIYNQAPIRLGQRVVISQGSYLCTGTHDYEDPRFPLRAEPILVGDLAWIAAQCFVHPGVTIGEGAVVGARSVVTKDVPPWMVCAGNPCQPIKPRVLKKV
jgi:putative colanic acid biosynthesis acetyltransferase WcaF